VRARVGVSVSNGVAVNVAVVNVEVDLIMGTWVAVAVINVIVGNGDFVEAGADAVAVASETF
jgi:hypothetical protein